MIPLERAKQLPWAAGVTSAFRHPLQRFTSAQMEPGMLRSVVWNFREGGASQVISRAVGRAGQLVYRSFAIDLYQSTRLDFREDLPENMTIREATQEDLVQGGHFKAVGFPEVTRRRFDEGFRCIAVYVDGNLAHASWLTIGRLPIDRGIQDLVADGIGGAYDCLTFPAYRGRGCLTHAIRSLCNRAGAEGLTRVIAAIHPGNRASIAGFERLGFRRIGQYKYVRVFGRTQTTHPAV
jgi:GNAT superfamily N-acetyltransferase